MKKIFKRVWSMIKYPCTLFKKYETAIWFYVGLALIVIFVLIPWGVGVITILTYLT